MVSEFETSLRKEKKGLKTVYFYTKIAGEYVDWYLKTKNEKSISLTKEDVKKFTTFLKDTKHYNSATIKIVISALKKFKSFLIAIDYCYDPF